MTEVVVTSNLDRFLTRLQYDEKQLRFAAAVTLTRTMKDAQGAVKYRMGIDFDRPTPWALNAFAIEPATKDKLEARLFPKEFGGTAAIKYLGPQIYGGRRNIKGSEMRLRNNNYLLHDEYIVPGEGAKLDAYGNISRGEMMRILSQLQAAGDQSETTRSRKRAGAKRQARYFAAERLSGAKLLEGGGLVPGIYRRDGKGIKPVLIFVQTPKYQKRLRYFETVDSTIDARLKPNFDAAWQMAMGTAR